VPARASGWQPAGRPGIGSTARRGLFDGVFALLYFVRNTEELAGTLCHEVSHTIHHDSMTLIEKEQKIARNNPWGLVWLFEGPS